MTNEAEVKRRTFKQWLAFKLFRQLALEPAPEEKGWAPGELGVTTVIRFDWKDRLRLMVSPWVIVETRTQTDRTVLKARSRTVTSVLPPWYRPPGPQVPAVEEQQKDWCGRFMTFDEIVDDLVRWAARHPKERSWLVELGMRNQLIETHHGFGRWVRNWYGLWREGHPLTMKDYKPEVVEGVDQSPRHPDAVSARLIQVLYERLQAERGA